VTNALTFRRTRTLPEIVSASFDVYGNSSLLSKPLVLSLPGVVLGLTTILLPERKALA
jgi:hypothetical protein